MNQKQIYEIVEKLVLKRVKSAKKAGKKFRHGSWATPDGRVCAVGALAFNGDSVEVNQGTSETFAVAAPLLLKAGIPESYVGLVLDALSDGFELGADYKKNSLYYWDGTSSACFRGPISNLAPTSTRGKTLYSKIYDLGCRIWEENCK